MSGPVHFVWIGGEWLWQHTRAVETARVHGAPIWLWGDPQASASMQSLPAAQTARAHIDWLHRLDVPDWLRDHPIGLANVKDLFAWRILHQHGGLYLDLDTISIAPVWDLLTRDVLVSREWPNESDGIHQYNSAVVAGRQGTSALLSLAVRAWRRLQAGESGWGECGPRLLTEVVPRFPDAFDVAEFGVLSGFRDDTVEADYYDRLPHPLVPDNARVLHLYSSSRPEKFAADRWWP